MTGKGYAGRQRALRGDRTQKEFAEVLGISQQRLSSMERGQLPSIQLLIRINKETQVNLNWLVLGHGRR